MISNLCLLLAVLSGPNAPAADDPYLWLEDVDSEKALGWVRKHNEPALARLQNDARYAPTEQAIREILLAKDRIPTPSLHQGWVSNFWQDETHVRGIWRRARLADYASDVPKWETVLDVDELSKKENENWVYTNAVCLGPEDIRCLVRLSRGGTDRSVLREYDTGKRAFVEGGFFVPEAKSRVAWADPDTLVIGTDFGPGTLTTSGYPRLLKLWKRGTPLEKAATLFEVEATDVAATPVTYSDVDREITVVSRTPAFFKTEYHLLSEGRLRRIPLPIDAVLLGPCQGRLFAKLRSAWKPAERAFAAGSLVALPIDSLDAARAESVLEPTEKTSIQAMAFTRRAAYASLLDDVAGAIVEVRRGDDGRWTAIRQPYPENGATELVTWSRFDDELIVMHSSPIVPSSLYVSARPGAEPKLLKRAPERFDAKGLTVERFFATSRDGSRIPYFVSRPQKLALDGSAPTLLYGYGGFELPTIPNYLGDTGKWWLEKGGVWVSANIRGGGEYGPRWHESVLKENREKVFEDFVAVAEDLIARKITSPQKLGIMGRSNGGLLVGAAFTRRPELFAAVSCGSPLLDMLRYHKLLAGASWIGEYGDPEDPALRDVIRGYSPYQNLSPDKKYPEVFFYTSTKDDRVHPGHARKMAARMEEMKHPFVYYENIEGGHSAAANLEQSVRRAALQAVYFYQKLMDAK